MMYSENCRYSDCQFSITSPPNSDEVTYRNQRVRRLVVRHRVGVELMQAREGLADQRTEQKNAEEEGEAVLAEEAHCQRLAMPT